MVNYTDTNPKLPTTQQKNVAVPRKIFLKKNIDYVTRPQKRALQGSFNTGNNNGAIDLYNAIDTAISRGWISSSGADGSETKVNAGTNISISGSGTTGSPYVISNTYATGATSNLNGAIGRYNDPGHWLLGGTDTSAQQIADEYTAIITKSEGVNDGQYLHIKFDANPASIGIMAQVEGVMVQDVSSQVFPVKADCVMINFGGTSVDHANDNSWTTDQVFAWYYSADNLPVLRITNARNLIGLIDITLTLRRTFASGLALPGVEDVVVNNTATHF